MYAKPMRSITDCRVKQKIGRITTVNRCAVGPSRVCSSQIDAQVIVTSQLATKLLTLENKPANFDTGDRAVLMPQLGTSAFERLDCRPS